MTATSSDSPAEQARAELVATLNAIEDKLNVPKRVGRAVDRGKVRFAELKRDNPGVLVAGIASAALAVGVGVWAIARSLSRR